MPLPLANVATSDTFRTWYTRVNEAVFALSNETLAANVVPYGVFALQDAANTSFGYGSKFNVNSSLILARANSTFAANVAVTGNALQMTVAANTLLLQSPGGTIINASPLTVNSLSTFTGNSIHTANVSVTANLSVTGQTTLTGNTVANGTFAAKQVHFTAANAAFVPANLTNPQYDNYGPAGFDEAAVVNFTPALDVVFTGFAAPSAVTAAGAGAIVKYVQNLSTTFKITFASANTSSSANNRFKTANDAAVDLPPQTSLMFIWSFTNREWRPMAPPASAFTNLLVNGTTTLNGNTTVNANATFGATPTLVVDITNNRVGVGRVPTSPFHVQGNAVFESIGTFNANAGFNAEVFHLGPRVVSTGNSDFSNGSLILDKSAKTAVFANTMTANSSSQSYIRNILITTLTVNAAAYLPNTAISGNCTIAGNTTNSGVFYSNPTGAARLVIPVGTNKYATFA